MTATIIDRNQNSKAAQADVVEETLFVSDRGATFEEVEMGIASDGIDFILDLLSDLSVNRGAYALREAYSNAYDATMATGDMTRKIEINLPLSGDVFDENMGITYKWNKEQDVTASYAIIRDHGCGMSEEDVRKYFTQYGGSKKREDDVNSIGSKGLGSKAPLACADSFTVKSVKDGILTTAIIERKNGRNYASIRAEQTDAENGTEVIIPVTSKQVATQMNECARSIAENNLDANLWINGTKREGLFSTDTTSAAYNRNGYVYIGVVNLGVDTNGEDVSFRMWQREDVFPTSDASSIVLNLAGVKYDLYNAPRGGSATLIVAGEPGFLNFTPSRDEIKDDAARLKFIDAIREALKDFDFSASVNDYIANKDMFATFGWLTSHCGVHRNDFTFGKDTTTINIQRNRRRWGWGSRNASANDYYAVTVDNDNLFMYDGVDCSWLLGNTAEQDACTGKFYAFKFDRFFEFANADKFESTPRYYKGKKTEIAGKIAANDLTMFDVNRFADYLNSNTWYERHNTYAPAAPKLVVISGVFDDDDATTDDNLRKFATFEKNIRDWVNSERIYYLVAEKGWTAFSDSEKAYLDSCFGAKNVTVTTIENAIVQAKAARNAAKTSKGTNGKPVSNVEIAMRLEVSTFIEDIDAVNIENADRVALSTFEEINAGDAATIDNSLFGANEVRELVKAGATVLVDVRKNVKNFADNLFADNGVVINSSTITVSPTIIYGNNDVPEGEKSAYICDKVMVRSNNYRVFDMFENVASIVGKDEFEGTEFDKAAKVLAANQGTKMLRKRHIELTFADDADVKATIDSVVKTVDEVSTVLNEQDISMFSRYYTYSPAEKKILAHGLVEFINDNFECAKA